jgi:hydroxymethylpyrimidine/phosphomethylpyrimidine kinase
MVAASGDPLLADNAVSSLMSELMPLADVITPNLHEAARMLETEVAASEQNMLDQAKRLIALGAKAVLLKGGHGGQTESVDLLLGGEGQAIWLRKERIATDNTHGTGCTLSSAIAAGLAKGQSLGEAVTAAKDYIHDAIGHADELQIGKGHGPVHHFHAFWSK